VLAGFLGNVRWIVAATIVMNAATAILLTLGPRAPGLESVFAREFSLLLPVAIVHQWLFAALMITIWLLFRRSLGAVGSAYERAKQLDQLKDEFIASVNHELRTPLMTMQTYLETIRDHPERIPPEQLAAALEQACRVGDSLIDLVKSILSTRQIDREGVVFTPEPVMLRRALETAITLVDPREAGDAGSAMAARDLHLDVPEQLVVWGERIRAQQILTNLLSNAVKYSPAGTPRGPGAHRLDPGGHRHGALTPRSNAEPDG